MRVETTKTNQVDKKEVRVNRNETSLFNSQNQLKPIDSPPAPTTGAFAKILEEARKDNGKEKENLSGGKNSATEHASENSKTEKEKETVRHSKEKNELEERNKRENNHGGQKNKDENPAFSGGFVGLQPSTKNSSDNSIPAARAILHVADLERIIATIRTQNFKNAQQALITLKNSVLEGLQIKITITEGGKLKAEFLALNEQIKKQLIARKRELADIFKNRSLKFSEINIFVESKFEKDS